jgi:hypothetical protein
MKQIEEMTADEIKDELETHSATMTTPEFSAVLQSLRKSGKIREDGTSDADTLAAVREVIAARNDGERLSRILMQIIQRLNASAALLTIFYDGPTPGENERAELLRAERPREDGKQVAWPKMLRDLAQQIEDGEGLPIGEQSGRL